MLELIVARVIALLHERENKTYTANMSELSAGLTKTVYLHHAQLSLLLPDLAFIQSLAAYDSGNPAVATLLEAWAYGVRLRLMVHRQLLTALPLRELCRLPVSVVDHLEIPVHMAAGGSISYANVVLFHDCWLLIERETFITPLARDVMENQNIKLIRRE
ncbi:microcompartment protein PduM [Sodalis ligni]|uniref:microcompartment protein PduM n=1 Tax=Sodalis ligni TaxID=2697027 RepID=UPI00193F4E9E|nr:microcompartment protein PduM [Sodalis ligni]QWA09305.1 microcompartment protein PduM [Sodalis ligni]